MPLTKTTKLQAINTMLSIIGEPPINSLTAARADSLIAQNILDEVMREVLSYGWMFNTEDNVELIPETATGYIYIGDSVVRVDMDPAFYNYDITIRGNRLYNRNGNSFVFQEPIKVTRVVLMDYDDMPEVARRYVYIRSARIFQDRVVGSEKLHAFTQADEIGALAKLMEYETESGDYTIFQGPDIMRTFMRHGSYRVY
jgi:hypothetical protein